MIHLIVGNTGSGKTTYSTELKRKSNGIIFSIDKWNKTLFLADKKADDGLEWFLERIDRAEKMIMELVTQLENSKTTQFWAWDYQNSSIGKNLENLPMRTDMN